MHAAEPSHQPNQANEEDNAFRPPLGLKLMIFFVVLLAGIVALESLTRWLR